jgi:hypothetical protein
LSDLLERIGARAAGELTQRTGSRAQAIDEIAIEAVIDVAQTEILFKDLVSTVSNVTAE